MGMDRGALAGEEHLVRRADRGGGAERRRGEAGVAENQRAALEGGCLVRDFAGPGELGVDVEPVPDVPALGSGRLGELGNPPERQCGQVCQPLVVVRDIGRGEGLVHCSSRIGLCAVEQENA
jgi:hypothetical protein